MTLTDHAIDATLDFIEADATLRRLGQFIVELRAELREAR